MPGARKQKGNGSARGGDRVLRRRRILCPLRTLFWETEKKEERKKRKEKDIKHMAAMIILTDIIVVNIIFTSSSRGILLLKLSLLVVM